MQKMNVVYFTAVDIGSGEGGGAICCKNHIDAMAHDPKINLRTVIAGPKNREQATIKYISSLGVPFDYLPSDEIRKFDPLRHLRYFSRKFPFSYEKNLRNKRHVDGSFSEILQKHSADAVVIDHLPSALYLPSLLDSSMPRCVVKFNREAEFHREAYIRRKQKSGKKVRNSFLLSKAFARWKKIEENIQNKCHGIVALSKNDLPKDKSESYLTAVIPPFLEFSDQQWTQSKNRKISFVGNISHFPNSLAIEWICKRFAPALAKLDPEITIRIIGAAAQDVPQTWRHPSVCFLGLGDREAVRDEFLTCDLFIAPIENNFGSKIKLLECIAFGTPFLGTRAALSGLSFIDSLPTIELDAPEVGAQIAYDLLSDDSALVDLSRNIHLQVVNFQIASEGIWGKTIEGAIAFAKATSKVPS